MQSCAASGPLGHLVCGRPRVHFPRLSEPLAWPRQLVAVFPFPVPLGYFLSRVPLLFEPPVGSPGLGNCPSSAVGAVGHELGMGFDYTTHTQISPTLKGQQGRRPRGPASQQHPGLCVSGEGVLWFRRPPRPAPRRIRFVVVRGARAHCRRRSVLAFRLPWTRRTPVRLRHARASRRARGGRSCRFLLGIGTAARQNRGHRHIP